MIVLVSGVLELVPLVAMMGGGTLRFSNACLYLGVVFLLSLLLPLLAARLFGKTFYTEYLRLGEARSGMSLRGPVVFVTVIAGAFLTGAAVLYVLKL